MHELDKLIQKNKRQRPVDSRIDDSGSYLKIKHKEFPMSDEDEELRQVFGRRDPPVICNEPGITPITLEDYKRYLLILDKAQLKYVRSWRNKFDSVGLRVDEIILKTPYVVINWGSDRNIKSNGSTTNVPAHLIIKVTDIKTWTLLDEIDESILPTDFYQNDYWGMNFKIVGETLKEVEDKINIEINKTNECRSNYINEIQISYEKYVNHLMSKYNLSKQDASDYILLWKEIYSKGESFDEDEQLDQFEVEWEYVKHKTIGLGDFNSIWDEGHTPKYPREDSGDASIRKHDSWQLVISCLDKDGELPWADRDNYKDIEFKRISNIKRKIL